MYRLEVTRGRELKRLLETAREEVKDTGMMLVRHVVTNYALYPDCVDEREFAELARYAIGAARTIRECAESSLNDQDRTDIGRLLGEIEPRVRT